MSVQTGRRTDGLTEEQKEPFFYFEGKRLFFVYFFSALEDLVN